MIIALREKRPGVYGLPEAFVGYAVTVIAKRRHLAPNAGSYYAAPLCGAAVDRSRLDRRGQFNEPELHICRECVRLAGAING